MAFQNMGTINGGMIQSSAKAMGAMDAAPGLASGGAFLESELEKRDTMIRKPLTSVTYPRDIEIDVGGGWADYVSAMSVSYGLTGGSGASPVTAGGANAIPVVQASVDKGLFKAHAFQVALRIMYQDMQRANFVGRSLDSLLTDGVRLAYDMHVEQNVYVGIADYNTTGLLNNADVTATTVANGVGGTATWVTKTPAEILKDINDAITTIWGTAGYDMDAIPNHILLPYEQYAYILNTPVSALATESILDYVQKNNIATKNGVDLFIGATKWNKGIGVGGADRMVVYVNKRRYLKMDELVPLTRAMYLANATENAYDTSYVANITEPEVMYTQTIMYFDGI